jgi:hypothetical protein
MWFSEMLGGLDLREEFDMAMEAENSRCCASVEFVVAYIHASG